MPHSDFTMQDYSNQDFLRLIEQRIRKEIRQNKLISLKKMYTLIEEDSLQSQVLLHFLKQIFHDRLNMGGGESIETDYLELYVSKRLSVFLDKQDSQLLLAEKITPLRSITEHEIREVAKILSLKGEFFPVDQKLIFDLQQKYPQTKPSFLKSFVNIEQLIKK